MRVRDVLTIEHGVPHGTVVAPHVDPGTEAPRLPLLLPGAHQLEVFEGLGDGLSIAVFGMLPIHPLLLHLLLGRVVHERQSLVDHPQCVPLDGLEVVRRKGDDVGLHPDLSQILHDASLILVLLLGGVGIVEPHDEPPPVPSGVVVVQQHGLGVSHVQVPRRLGGEARRDAPGVRALEVSHPRHEGIHRRALLQLRLVVPRDVRCELRGLPDRGMARYGTDPAQRRARVVVGGGEDGLDVRYGIVRRGEAQRGEQRHVRER
mmetsp:Transcript_3533/g.9016  ORF Transcript_3533/g.9016 Transcript_3533/m.9016 type:complete len:261 (-) Transcript_3533:1005-1787(-)